MKRTKEYPLTFIGIIGFIILLIIILFHSFIYEPLTKDNTTPTSCPVCYHCAASNNGEVFYNDRIYPLLNESDIIKSIEDAKERFEYLLDYNSGNFTYDRITCGCSDIPENVYIRQLQVTKGASDIRYNSYIEQQNLEKQNQPISQKGPKQ